MKNQSKISTKPGQTQRISVPLPKKKPKNIKPGDQVLAKNKYTKSGSFIQILNDGFEVKPFKFNDNPPANLEVIVKILKKNRERLSQIIGLLKYVQSQRKSRQSFRALWLIGRCGLVMEKAMSELSRKNSRYI